MISFGGSMWRYLKNSNSALIKKKPLSELISPMSLMGRWCRESRKSKDTENKVVF